MQAQSPAAPLQASLAGRVPTAARALPPRHIPVSVPAPAVSSCARVGCGGAAEALPSRPASGRRAGWWRVPVAVEAAPLAAAMETVEVDLGDRTYPIYIGRGLLEQGELLRRHVPGKRALIVTNETVGPLYLDRCGRSPARSAVSALLSRWRACCLVAAGCEMLVALHAAPNDTL